MQLIWKVFRGTQCLKTPSITTPSLAKKPIIKKLAATIKNVKTKNALRNFINRIRKRSKKKSPASKKKPPVSKKKSPKLKLKTPKISPGKMRVPPNSPDDDWLKKRKKKSSPKSPKKKSSYSTIDSNKTDDSDISDIIADQLNYLNINTSPTGTPPEIRDRKSQPYSNVVERLTPDSNTPPHDLHSRRGATPLIIQVGEWGPDDGRHGINAIDEQLKKEEAKTNKSKKNSSRK